MTGETVRGELPGIGSVIHHLPHPTAVLSWLGRGAADQQAEAGLTNLPRGGLTGTLLFISRRCPWKSKITCCAGSAKGRRTERIDLERGNKKLVAHKIKHGVLLNCVTVTVHYPISAGSARFLDEIRDRVAPISNEKSDPDPPRGPCGQGWSDGRAISEELAHVGPPQLGLDL